jgi:hypothetical protein
VPRRQPFVRPAHRRLPVPRRRWEAEPRHLPAHLLRPSCPVLPTPHRPPETRRTHRPRLRRRSAVLLPSRRLCRPSRLLLRH